MMKYDLTWRDHLAFRYASSQSRRDVIRNALLVIGLMVIYGVVGAMDYQIEQRLAVERQLSSEAAYAQTLRDCMSGAVGFYFPDTKRAYECKVMPL